MVDWSKVKYFKQSEFVCSCGCGRADVTPGLVMALDALREAYGKPMTITSGFRCENHPEERDKPTPGAHGQGRAADISTPDASSKYELKRHVYALGFLGVGHGKTFTHLDVGHDAATRPADWTY